MTPERLLNMSIEVLYLPQKLYPKNKYLARPLRETRRIWSAYTGKVTYPFIHSFVQYITAIIAYNSETVLCDKDKKASLLLTVVHESSDNKT